MSTHNIWFYGELTKNYPLINIRYPSYLFCWKIWKLQMPENIDINILKFEQCGFTQRVMSKWYRWNGKQGRPWSDCSCLPRPVCPKPKNHYRISEAFRVIGQLINNVKPFMAKSFVLNLLQCKIAIVSYFMLKITFYSLLLFEPPLDKTNKMTVCPAKTQISLGIRPVWSESSLCAHG